MTNRVLHCSMFCVILSMLAGDISEAREVKIIAEPVANELMNKKVVTRIACGSCYRTHYKNAGNIWPVIAETKPELFIFMGDNIYSDTHDMNLMRKRYSELNEIPEYATFRKHHKILAIWDDHDYGVNDAGAEFPHKIQSQKNFLDAFDYADDHPARARKGIYHSHTQGPEGKRLQIINLDTRYHRSALKKGDVTIKTNSGKYYKTSSYLPLDNKSSTMLGAEQWTWLKAELAKKSDLCFIVTSIQFLTEGHIYEKWSNLPREREKMLKLLKEFPNKRVVFLSGDRHLAEISKMSKDESGLTYDLVELTSSGLTHAGASMAKNKYRVEGSYFNKVNFATIQIDWMTTSDESPAPTVKLKIHDRNGQVQTEKVVKF